MSTFKERVEWILTNRPKFRGSMSRLSLAAQMSRTSLDKTVKRSETTKGIQKMEDHNLRALAEVAEVSEPWLRSGVGSPEAQPKTTLDLTLRKDAAEMLQRGHGLPEEKAWLLMRDAEPNGPELKHYYFAGLELLRREAETPKEISHEKAEAFFTKNRRKVRA